MHQNLARTLGVQHIPHAGPLFRRQCFQQTRSLGRVHLPKRLAHPLELARFQRVTHTGNLSRRTVFVILIQLVG